MTTPVERTRSVYGTRQLLAILAAHTGPFNHRLVRTLAIQLLRHFPSDADITLSSNSLPALWGTLREDYSQSPTSRFDAPVTKKSLHSSRNSQSR
ncbi:BPSL0761 family protein [Paraburkholderia sp. BR10936]|uniref:BPSL0761 family protein n=1 Tax=Paraburkholderia sp. BR10936 TaxID=3236993 RepID=UPI0034D29E39